MRRVSVGSSMFVEFSRLLLLSNRGHCARFCRVVESSRAIINECAFTFIPGAGVMVDRKPHSMPRDARILSVSELDALRGCDMLRGGILVRLERWS